LGELRRNNTKFRPFANIQDLVTPSHAVVFFSTLYYAMYEHSHAVVSSNQLLRIWKPVGCHFSYLLFSLRFSHSLLHTQKELQLDSDGFEVFKLGQGK